MKVILEIIKGPEKGKRFEFTEPDTFLVGRSEDATFKLLNDPYVSRRHFHLEINPPNAYFKDLESKNTPRINNVITVEKVLEDGDIIEVGFTHIKVGISEQIEYTHTKCIRCGNTFSVLSNEIPGDYCESCSDQIAKAMEIKAKEEIKITCKCGKDLTSLANSDNRAAELMGKVIYSCPDCLPKAESKNEFIDEYKVIRKLGEGGMGIVYMVYHPATGRIMVLKKIIGLIKPELAKRFEREINLLSKLDHPHIIHFVDNGIFNGAPYMVMEFAGGGDLNRFFNEKDERKRTQQIIGILIKCLEGFEYIHGQQIIHRDIKPENILLSATEDGILIPKISDLGLAKSISNAGGTSFTKVGVAMGTMLYLSPEQILDAKNVDHRADLYSLGITLYFLLSKKYPFVFPTAFDIQMEMAKDLQRYRNFNEVQQELMRRMEAKHPLNIILSEEPIPIAKQCTHLPPELAHIVDKSIRKDKASRFQSATEFKKALSEYAYR